MAAERAESPCNLPTISEDQLAIHILRELEFKISDFQRRSRILLNPYRFPNTFATSRPIEDILTEFLEYFRSLEPQVTFLNEEVIPRIDGLRDHELVNALVEARARAEEAFGATRAACPYPSLQYVCAIDTIRKALNEINPTASLSVPPRREDQIRENADEALSESAPLDPGSASDSEEIRTTNPAHGMSS